jgi:hypothetical protein
MPTAKVSTTAKANSGFPQSCLQPSRWPSVLSVWWIPILLGVGYGPLMILGLVARYFLAPEDARFDHFAFGWSFTAAPVCLFLAVIAAVVQLIRFCVRVLHRERMS